MGDGELEVSLRAKFSSNLDVMGRQLGAFQQKARGYAREMREWARGVPTDKMLQTHIRLGAEIDGIQTKMRGAKEEYLKWSEKAHVPGLDRKAIGEAKRNADEALQIMVRLFQDQSRIKGQMGLMEGGAAGGISGRQGMVGMRRMLRFGLGALGLPLTIAAAGRSVGEAKGQQEIIQGLAARLSPLNEGMEGFDEHISRLRRNIVEAGAEFAFAGRETLMLADALSKISGIQPDVRTTLEGARGLGVSTQLSGQLLAFARRFQEGPVGGAGGKGGDARLMNIVARGIADSGMMPRGGEYIQTIVETMQQYATRVPSLGPNNVDSIESLVYAINKTNIPTLRGQGATTLMRGMTAMMDDMSEPMIAMQTEVLRKNPGLMQSFAKRNLPGLSSEEMQSGSGRFFVLSAMKQAGIADSDGLKLGGATLREMTNGMSRVSAMLIQSMMLRISPQMVNALSEAGFMKKFLSGEISDKQLRQEGANLRWRAQSALTSPAMAWGRLGSQIKSRATSMGENVIGGSSAELVSSVARGLEDGSLSATDAAGMLMYGLPKTMATRGARGLGKGLAGGDAGTTLQNLGGAMTLAGGIISMIPGGQALGIPMMYGGITMGALGTGGRMNAGPWDRLGESVGYWSQNRARGQNGPVEPIKINLEIASIDPGYRFAHQAQITRQTELADGTPIEIQVTTVPVSGIIPPNSDPYLQAAP